MHTYLARLRHELDSSTLKATLNLMLRESRDAIDRQRSLIALERLARRHSPIRLRQLHALEQSCAMVLAALLAADEATSGLKAVVMGACNVVSVSDAAH